MDEYDDDDRHRSRHHRNRHRNHDEDDNRHGHRRHHHENKEKGRIEAIAQQRMRAPAEQVTKNMHNKPQVKANWKLVLEAAKKEAEAAKAAAEEAPEVVAAANAAVNDAVERLDKIANAVKIHAPTSGMVLQTDAGVMMVARRERGDHLSVREMVFLFINEPASGRIAYLFGRLMQILLIASALTTTYETVTWVNEVTGPAVWLYTKICFNIIFSVEALMRIVTFVPLRRIHRSYFVWLDLVTVSPLWLRMVIDPASMRAAEYLSKNSPFYMRVIEACAAFRILKLCRYFEGANVLALAIAKSLGQLLVPLFMLTLMVFCFASIVFEIEYDGVVHSCVSLWLAQGIPSSFLKAHADGVEWGCDACTLGVECPTGDTKCVADFEQKCNTCVGYPTGHPECLGVAWGQTFQDIPRSMWFMFVTVSTVGYGDVSPGTWQGQIFVCIVIICGLIFIAMPLAIVGSTFGAVWDERQLTKLQRHLRQLLAENGIDPNDAVIAFSKMDASHDGKVTYNEFRGFCNEFRMSLEAEGIRELWKALDVDGSGSMMLEEFIERAYPGIDLASVAGLAPNKSDDSGATMAQTKRRDFEATQRSQHRQVIDAIAAQATRTEALEAKMVKFELVLGEISQSQQLLQQQQQQQLKQQQQLQQLLQHSPSPSPPTPASSKLVRQDSLFRDDVNASLPSKEKPGRSDENGSMQRRASRREHGGHRHRREKPATSCAGMEA